MLFVNGLSADIVVVVVVVVLVVSVAPPPLPPVVIKWRFICLRRNVISFSFIRPQLTDRICGNSVTRAYWLVGVNFLQISQNAGVVFSTLNECRSTWLNVTNSLSRLLPFSSRLHTNNMLVLIFCWRISQLNVRKWSFIGICYLLPLHCTSNNDTCTSVLYQTNDLFQSLRHAPLPHSLPPFPYSLWIYT